MGRIVHVDNSDFFRKAMRAFLAELGFEVLEFDRGEDAIADIAAGNVSCLITGLELQDMKGEEFIRRIRSATETMTVIAVTASEDDARVRNLKSLGITAIIHKGGDWKEKLREYF